ncbi:hypothetical protein [Mucilaginibacter phyllosphaerae]|uniref:Uncharacterized protein n=1 Tax=Mucilaginibacter phyllosphaerae TaxID=1812349 RepID=A0A4Y8A9J7_9SPHI|nr:hypothetical protein [Mucilaginibacter phyllosphaerae]MBB3969721.1 hypothetical protein [Mucilaginibacter phyllosphaerae]TEW65104.1 hypothetical protein E2R65_14405 [Mucilaginibacter phyllosphaerae]GGH17959.1 hypothetical protein GCM10007352_28360 [Mucilaginibacter phyllosphaerae]
MQPTETQLKKKIKCWLIFLIAGLFLSGATAFPIESELAIAVNNLDAFSPKIQQWLTTIYTAVKTTNAQYPYLSYGTDWLAFAHVILALLFVGPLRDPVRNIWVLQFGMIACVLILPLAFIAGPIRHIPLFWQLIDCSFGVVGIVPLYIAYRYTKQLESITNYNHI